MTDSKKTNANPSKIALVTGGLAASGRNVATRLARDGFAVVVHYPAMPMRRTRSWRRSRPVAESHRRSRGCAVATDVERSSNRRPTTSAAGSTWSEHRGILPLRPSPLGFEVFDKVIVTTSAARFSS